MTRMIKQLRKVGFVSLVLLFFVAMIPLQVFAASSGNYTPAEGVKVEVSGATDTSGSTSITVTAKGSKGILGYGASAKSAKIKITNNSGSDATLSCAISRSNVNSLTTDKGDVSESAFTVKLANEEVATLTLTTAKDDKENKIVLSDFKCVKIAANATASVVYDGSRGTVTLGGSSISSGGSATAEAGQLAAVATPASGYSFLGWFNTNTREIVSLKANDTLNVPQSMNIQAVFVNSAGDDPWFQVGTYMYNSFSDAVTKAGASGTVILMNNAVISGNWTIPANITLLIPYDSENISRGAAKEYTLERYGLTNSDFPESPEHSIIRANYHANNPRTEYRRLTLADNATITVNGALEVSGQSHSLGKGQWGKYGLVQMGTGSKITVNSGAKLYVWGYIRGNGTVEAMGGAEVYEPFDIADYPSAGANTMTSMNSEGVLAFKEYAVHGVEVPMTLHYNARNIFYICLSGYNIGYNTFRRDFVGPGEDAIIQLTSGTYTKSYVSGRQQNTVNGDALIKSFKISVGIGSLGFELDTNKTGLCFPSTWDFVIKSGKTLTTKLDVPLLAGSTLTIEENATFAIGSGKSVYAFDATEDPSSVATDAKIDVNGTIVVDGGFYTTPSGAEIYSSKGTGKVTINSVGTKTTVKMKASDSATADYAIIPAKLPNSGNTAVDTASGTPKTYNYTNGFWRCETHTGVDTDHTCDVCGFITECVDTNDHNCDVCGKEAITVCTDADGNAICDICSKVLCEHTDVAYTEMSAATCEANGHKEYWTCNECKYYFEDAECNTLIENLDTWLSDVHGGMIAALGHNYVVVEDGYIWAEDFSKCTASGICSNDATHTAILDSQNVEVVETPATCSNTGSIDYTATFAETEGWTTPENQTASVKLEIEPDAHADTNFDHLCDYCCTAYLGTHADGDDANHTCDYCGGAVEGEACADEDSNHKCDECGENLTQCVDENKDHVCDLEGCKASMGEHKNGTKTHICDYCGQTASGCEDTTGDGDHNCDVCGARLGNCDENVEIPAKAPTCTDTGLTAGKKCSECGTVQVEQTTVAATGHTAGAAATCTTAQTCTVCNAELTAATGHTLTQVEAKAPTCTEAGYEAYEYCSACDYTTYKEVAATGHNYNAVVTAPTCTASGYTTYTCACGDTYVADEVAASGHNYTEAVTKTPTCTETGVKTFTCTCGDSYTEAITAKGHALTSVEAKAPTCTEAGYEAYEYCSACDYTTYKEVAATGHNYNAVVTAPTCTASGYTTYTCACGDTYVADEVAATGHNYTEAVTKTPTCTETGVKTFTCTCGDSYTEAIAAKGHALTSVEAKAPTCTVGGYEAYEYCSACDYTTYKEVAATGHNYNAVVTAPTCTASGYTTYTCACGDTYVTDQVAATGHNYTAEETKAPTCTETGVKTFTCTCGDSYTEAIAAKGHALTSVEAKAPTCTVGGYEAYEYCSACSYTTFAEVAATGHDYDAVVTAPTCTAAGYTTYTCACGDTYVADEVAATGHNYTAEETKAPTCTEAGVKTFTCTCGDSYTEAIAAKGHALTSVEAKAPTCTEAGYEAYEYCSACDYTTYKEVAATGHNYNAVVTAPTCTASGYTTYTCACGDTYVADEVAASGHNYTEAVTKTPTCTEAGVKTFTCTCGDSYTEAIAAKGHALTSVEAKAPTCTEAGYEAYEYCSACDYTTYKAVEATGHTWVDATYTTPKTCSVCNATEGDPMIKVEFTDGQIDDEVVHELIETVKNAVVQVVQPEDPGFNKGENAQKIDEAMDQVKDKNGNYVDPETVTTYSATLTIKLQNVSVGKNAQGAATVKKFTYDVTPYLYAMDENGEVMGQTELNDFAQEIIFRLPVPNETEAKKVKLWHNNDNMGYYDILVDNQGNKYVEVSSLSFSPFAAEIHDEHEYTEVETTAPGCTTTGLKTFTCECGETATEEIAATGHKNTVIKDAKDATCSDSGYTGDTYCNDCKSIVEHGTTIPATGEHHYDEGVQTKDPTTTEMGEMTYTCTVCGDSRVEDIPMLEAPAGITVNFVNYTGSKNEATIVVNGEAIEYQKGVAIPKVVDENATFVVRCDIACAVIAVTVDENSEKTYTRLSARQVAEGYEFTITNPQNNMEVVVALKGDINLDGSVTNSDSTQIRAYVAGKKVLEALNLFSGDANGDGKVTNTDSTRVRAVVAGKINMKWEG